MNRAKRLSRKTYLAVIQDLVETEVLDCGEGETTPRALTLAEDGTDFADALIHGTMEHLRASETMTFDRDAVEQLDSRLRADS